MYQQESSIYRAIKKINLIHKAMLFGPITIGAILYLLSKDKNQELYFASDPTLILMAILSFIFILTGDMLFRKFISKIADALPLKEKLKSFQTAYALRISLIKGPAIAIYVFYYSTLNQTYLIIAGILVLYIFLLTPTKEKIALHLNLKSKDKADLLGAQ